MSERNSVFHVISDIENDVRDIGRWAELVSLIGSSPHMVDPGVLHVLSGSLKLLGTRIEADWEKAFRLAAGRDAR